MTKQSRTLSIVILAALLMAACGQASQANRIDFTLKTAVRNGQMAYVGVGDGIDGVVNPTLVAPVGTIVQLKLISSDGALYNISFPDFNTTSPNVFGKGKSVSAVFGVDRAGQFAYFSDLPGQREAGMQGVLEVEGGLSSSPTTSVASAGPTSMPGAAANVPAAAVANATSVVPTSPTSMPGMTMSAPAAAVANSTSAPATGADIVRDPTDLPAPIGDRGPTTVRVDLETQEVVGQLAEGTTFTYWTFNGKVPGPFVRVRVGDTVEVHLKNAASSIMPHSVDFHAVTGPGGGAVFTTTQPGAETSFTFKALNPGLFVYHCATPPVALHIANGMYGLILVEPEGGLPAVDHEFYVMQGEIYTTGNFGDTGAQAPDVSKLLNETPDYYVFNGAVGALTTEHPLSAKVGETVRFFFGVGGPNKISSFHIIGEIMDRVYDQASLTSPALTNVQTTLVPPGGATVVELQLQVPGRYIFLDHAISRLQRGLAGYLVVEGPDAPDIFNGTPMPGSGH
jgi:nitrite reductase (NO-forming)